MGDYDTGPAVVSRLVASALLAIAAGGLWERRTPNKVTYLPMAGAAVYRRGMARAPGQRQVTEGRSKSRLERNWSATEMLF